MNDAEAKFTTLQELMWPEPGICTEQHLYFRNNGVCGPTENGFRFFSGSGIGFNTWFNLFNVGTWKRQCGLETLSLLLEGEGTFKVTVFGLPKGRSGEQRDYIVDLSGDVPWIRLDLSDLMAEIGDTSVIFFELQVAGEEALLKQASWQTEDVARRQPKIALAVTTFRRESEVAQTVERFCAFRKSSHLKDHVELLITDNGKTLNLPPREAVTVIGNENLGGAGGFTRGLLEARARGASHCLFMDDDASIHMPSLERTWALLAYAKDPATAVAGAMISEQHRWAIWENGARFFGRCQPLYMGTDLRDFHQAMAMEWDISGPPPSELYGGWWYFAFPLAQVSHLAFPFFVRGDDVSFSLINAFNIVRLNGVVSFQESFTEKESPQTWYLDLRSHMAHHLSLPALDVGKRGVLKIPVWFFLRNLPRMHYETLAAINLALEDVMKGPSVFDEHADMAQRRADLKALTQQESWKDLPDIHALPPVRNAPPAAWKRHMMKLCLNGLLLPGFSHLGKKITVLADHRGALGFCWGASEITFVNATGNKTYTVRHSKKAAWREIRRFAKNAVAFLKSYESLLAAYRAEYDTLTSEGYWRSKLSLEDHNMSATAERDATTVQ